MNKFLIFGNESKDKNLRVSKEVIKLLQQKGAEAVLFTDETSKKVIENIDCIIVVGGDGTLLKASWMFRDEGLPLLGINMGTLGYLAEVSKNEIDQALNALIENRYLLEERMMIKGELIKKNGNLEIMYGLNDIVLFKDASLSMIRYNLIVNDKLLYTYNADGIIVSTPTGSTGYSLACGGPIIEPTAENILVTPISAHSLNARSVVLSSLDNVKLEVCKIRSNISSRGRVSCDGVKIGSLGADDLLTIYKSSKVTKLIKLEHKSFLETLRQKMSV